MKVVFMTETPAALVRKRGVIPQLTRVLLTKSTL